MAKARFPTIILAPIYHREATMKKIGLVLVFVLLTLAGDNMLLTTGARADDHAQICLNNYNQCLTNYNGCLGQ